MYACPNNSVPLHVHIEKEAGDQITIKRFCITKDASLRCLETKLKDSAPCVANNPDIEFEWSWLKDCSVNEWAPFSREEDIREQEFQDVLSNHTEKSDKPCPMRLRVRPVKTGRKKPDARCKTLGCQKSLHHKQCSVRSAWKTVGAASNYCNNLVKQESLLGCPFGFLKEIFQAKCFSNLGICNKSIISQNSGTSSNPTTSSSDLIHQNEQVPKRETEYVLQHEALAMMGLEMNSDQWELNERLLHQYHGCLRSTTDALYKLHK